MVTNKGDLKHLVCEIIDAHRNEIIELGQTILENPELGFKEIETAKLVAQKFRELGLAPRERLAITGVKAVARGYTPGPTVAILGEMDALINYEHPFANPETGATHCCGHNAQVASMLGVAIGLIESGALAHLAGNVAFMAVPAEEFIEIEYRLNLRQRGKIEFLGGKQELIRLGEFDDIDMAMMVHSASIRGEAQMGIGGRGLAFVAKQIQYIGKTAHASIAPFGGINALNAALLGLMAIHVQRETFSERDNVRVHPIITRGGDVVNAVPDDVRIETHVRAATTEALLGANEKVDRALQAGAMAIGASVRIKNIPGYLSIPHDRQLSALFKKNAVLLLGKSAFTGPSDSVGGASGDIGDVCHIMPALMAFARGWAGYPHTSGYLVKDNEVAYILPAKVMAMTVIDLLWEHARIAENILDDYSPLMTKEEYLSFMRNLFGESVFPSP